jgi:hypothetical protein
LSVKLEPPLQVKKVAEKRWMSRGCWTGAAVPPSSGSEA